MHGYFRLVSFWSLMPCSFPFFHFLYCLDSVPATRKSQGSQETFAECCISRRRNNFNAIQKDAKPDYEKAERIYKMAVGMELRDESELIERLKELKTKREKNA